MAATYRDILEDLKETASRFAERSGEPAWVAAMLEPGWLALAWYRLTHWLYRHKQPVLAGLITRQVRRSTGIELHPGARIGRRCMLLGGPMLIGETAVIGDDCVIEPGVVMHGVGVGAGERRHPSLGDRVRVEAGAILVGDLFLGNDVRVSAGAVVTRDVPDGGLAVGVPGRVLPRDEARPDPDARAIQALAERLYHMEEQLQVMAFALSRTHGERWRTRQPEQYGPIAEVESLIDGAGI